MPGCLTTVKREIQNNVLIFNNNNMPTCFKNSLQ